MPDTKATQREMIKCPWMTLRLNNVTIYGETPVITSVSTRFGDCLLEKCAAYKNNSCQRVSNV